MQFGILGPLAVWQDGQELSLGGAKQRALLCILLLRANETVATPRLVDELWGEAPPASAVKVAQVYVSQLRKVLGEGVLLTEPVGYRLRVDAGGLDLEGFEGLLRQGRQLLAEDSALEAAEALRKALALWRGPPLAGFEYEQWAANEIGRLEALRLTALELRLQADLALGRHAEVVGELTLLVRGHPLQESLRGLLMLALYRAGRQADALDDYQKARNALVEELGIEPGRALRELHQAILRQDPILDLVPKQTHSGESDPAVDDPVVSEHLPSGTVTFLFTDIEGSTRLVRTLGDRYVDVFASYQDVLRSTFVAHEGVVIDTQGDSFSVAFDSVHNAVSAAADAQRQLAETPWPHGATVRVRIGLHTAQAMPTEGRYIGLAVRRGARICEAAHGGQIVVSQATMALLEDEEATLGIAVRDLGASLLKDFERPVRLYQVDTRDREADFPPLGTRSSPAADSPDTSAGGGAFVGRRREVAMLEAALNSAEAGQGQLVMVSGEPGIGKTRLLVELATIGERRGLDVVLGRCYEREGAPPFWPWVQAIRAYTERMARDEVEAALKAAGPAVAEIFPDLRGWLPGLPPAPQSEDPKQARFRIFDSVASLLRHAAATRPLVILLEDFHAADTGSLLLLEFVANEIARRRLLIVCTYRDIDVSLRRPLARTLHELDRSQSAQRLRLHGLSTQEAAAFIGAGLGADPSEGLLATLHARTEGNPLFLAELVRLLAEEGELERAEGHGVPVRVPEGIREAIGQRLDRLSATCNRVLTIASAIGRGFRFEQLQLLIENVSSDELLNALDEALVSRLIEELPDSVGRYQFSHALIRETLAGELPTTRRLRLHAQIAETLEQLYAGQIDEHAEELAYQFAEAESILGPDKVYLYSRLAGEQAISAHAYEEAIVQFERALAVKVREPLDAECAGLLFSLARAELGARELYEVAPALARLVQAFEYYAAAGDVESALEVATHPVPPVWESTGFPEAVESALALADDESIEAGRLLSTLGWLRSVHQRDHAGGEQTFERALAIARRQGDQALERRTLVSAAHADYWHLAWARCRERGLQAAELAADANDQRTEMAAREWPARVGAIIGNLAEARDQASAAVVLAEKLRERHELANACMYSSWLYSIAGDWAGARSLSNRALALEPREPRSLSTRALLELQTGQRDDGDRYLKRLLDPGRVTNWSLLEKFAMAASLPMAARILGTPERLELARVAAESGLAATGMPPFMHLYGRIGLAFIAVERTDTALAAAQYEAFEPQRGTAIVMAGIAVDRLLALLAAVQGHGDAARAHFMEALAFTSRSSYLPELAWSAADFAETILAGAVPGDAQTVRDLRAQALDIARSLGMSPLVRRVEAFSPDGP